MRLRRSARLIQIDCPVEIGSNLLVFTKLNDSLQCIVVSTEVAYMDGMGTFQTTSLLNTPSHYLSLS